MSIERAPTTARLGAAWGRDAEELATSSPADDGARLSEQLGFAAESYGRAAFVLHPDPEANSHWSSLAEVIGADATEESMGPVKAVLACVRARACACIVVERKYVDPDFRSDYSAFWSRRFADRGWSTVRLHFFSSRFGAESLTRLDPTTVGYLGYMVVRPTALGCVGRTVIAPTPIAARARLTYVVDRVNLFGNQLKVVGVPFCQQDGEMLRCAHVAAWICHYVAYSRGIVPRRLTADLDRSRRDSRHRMWPSSGLVAEQLQATLSDLGTPALFLDIDDLPKLPAGYRPARHPFTGPRREQILRTVCTYLNSGFPVIVLTATGHAMTLVGWEKLGKDAVRLIAADDQIGPYEVIDDPLSDDKQGPHRGAWTALMIPLPPKAYLTGAASETRVRQVVEAQAELERLAGNVSGELGALAARLTKLRGSISVRARLIESNRYKDAVLRQGRSDDVCRLLRIAHLPLWVWIVELHDRARRDESPLNTPCVLAEVVLDSTSHSDDPTVCLFSTPSDSLDAGLLREDASGSSMAHAFADGAGVPWLSLISQIKLEDETYS